jgi:hypothetical protein
MVMVIEKAGALGESKQSSGSRIDAASVEQSSSALLCRAVLYAVRRNMSRAASSDDVCCVHVMKCMGTL